jgi:hypothetical protein
MSDAGAAADKWGRATSGPVASGSVRKGEERMRQRRCSFKPIQTSSNGFKFAQTFTDPKGAFACSKNWK